MNVILNKENVGCVGARLIYPDCSNSKINQEKSYTIQHEGIIFKACDYIKPVNKNNGQKYYTNTNIQAQQIIAITAACMLIKKSVFNKVGGFQEEYVYGYEDVDLCLKLHKSGYKNYYTPQAMLYHYEFGTQEMEENKVEDKTEKTFKERYLAGEIEFEEIDRYISRWNNSDDERTLAKFLGLNADEEDAWIDDGDEALKEMLDAGKQ